MTLRAERHSARMSKLINDGLTRSGTGCFPYDNSERQMVKEPVEYLGQVLSDVGDSHLLVE